MIKTFGKIFPKKVETPIFTKTIVRTNYLSSAKINKAIPVVAKEIQKVNTGKRVIHNGWAKDDVRQKWLQYLYDNGGEDAMRTFLAENGTMGITRPSGIPGKNGYRDYGICQMNAGWHPDILGGSNGKRFKDWFYDPYKQMDYCIKKFKGGTKFYAYKYRFQRTKSIIIY